MDNLHMKGTRTVLVSTDSVTFTYTPPYVIDIGDNRALISKAARQVYS